MLKVTLKFSFYCVIFLFTGCTERKTGPDVLVLQRYQDSLTEARIDSAYLAIRSNCDTLLRYQVPKMVDSFLKDSALLQAFFVPGKAYSDVDKKLERVVRQLQADCDSNLQKETYRIARLRQVSKPKPRKRSKA